MFSTARYWHTEERRGIIAKRGSSGIAPPDAGTSSRRRNSCIRSGLRFQAAHLLFTSAAPEHLVGCFFLEKIGKPLNILSREIFPLLALESISRNASLPRCHPSAAAVWIFLTLSGGRANKLSWRNYCAGWLKIRRFFNIWKALGTLAPILCIQERLIC